MQKAVYASLYHNIKVKDNKRRHKFCPNGKESWCRFKREGELKDQPHHLDSVFRDHLEPIYIKRLASYGELSRYLLGVTNQLESINSRFWERVPKHKFHGDTSIRIAACSTIMYYNKGAAGKFCILSNMNLPVFGISQESAKMKDQERLEGEATASRAATKEEDRFGN